MKPHNGRNDNDNNDNNYNYYNITMIITMIMIIIIIYVRRRIALASAVYDRLRDGIFSSRIISIRLLYC